MVGFHLSQLKSPARTGSTGTESAITVDYIGPSRTNGYSITRKRAVMLPIHFIDAMISGCAIDQAKAQPTHSRLAFRYLDFLPFRATLPLAEIFALRASVFSFAFARR